MFVVIGIGLPLAVEYFSPTLSKYIQLPSSNVVWAALVLLGGLFAVTSFLQTAYSKGDFPWLFGKVGGGLVNALFFTYLFLLLPNSLASSGVSSGVSSSGLLTLVYLAVGLSYAYLLLDFVDARRTKAERVRTGNPEAG